MNTVEFKEQQGFRTWWAWAALAAFNILFVYAIIQQVILGKPFGPKPAPLYVLFIAEALLLLLLIFVLSIKLKTRINEEGIHYSFFPFQIKEQLIEWHELKDAYIREYNSFYEYGGTGIRIGAEKTGRAVNTSQSGNKGLQLQFRDGRLLLIGTRRSAAIKEIIDDMTRKGKINRQV